MTGCHGVEGNARITASLGAVLLVALAAEGVTLLGVSEMLTLHVFVGLFVIPVVTLKLATTGYRFFHYYRRTAAYRRKGPPHPVLRIVAPFVVVTTLALLGTGVVMLAVGPQRSDLWLTLHKGSFIAWFVVMTLHVLGHVLETWRLTSAEMRAASAVPRRGVRLGLVGGSLVVGIALGVASLGWTGAWSDRSGRDDEGLTPVHQMVVARGPLSRS